MDLTRNMRADGSDRRRPRHPAARDGRGGGGLDDGMVAVGREDVQQNGAVLALRAGRKKKMRKSTRVESDG